MKNDREKRVTYPEFYNLPDGDLLFMYRDGSSGRGNLVLNRYHTRTRTWIRLQDKLIDGEDIRSAYWQGNVDVNGGIHVSWVWRETPDVMTNHDLCYAKSTDGGKTWSKSTGEQYRLPITAETAEYILRIPQRSELINQTSMTTDSAGYPYIAGYWRPANDTVPQYQLVYRDSTGWKNSQIGRRSIPFSIAGAGTRRIPISRPQVVVTDRTAFVIFRDAERGDLITVASLTPTNGAGWKIKDLTTSAVGMWEPTYDAVAWTQRKSLFLFVQRVGQGEAEGLENVPPQMISVLEWRPRVH
jgi:hypothetical protein